MTADALKSQQLEIELQTLRNRVGDLVHENQTLRIVKGALEKRIAELVFGGIDSGQ
jgi:regulator of replication initiation timing